MAVQFQRLFQALPIRRQLLRRSHCLPPGGAGGEQGKQAAATAGAENHPPAAAGGELAALGVPAFGVEGEPQASGLWATPSLSVSTAPTFPSATPRRPPERKGHCFPPQVQGTKPRGASASHRVGGACTPTPARSWGGVLLGGAGPWGSSATPPRERALCQPRGVRSRQVCTLLRPPASWDLIPHPRKEGSGPYMLGMGED